MREALAARREAAEACSIRPPTEAVEKWERSLNDENRHLVPKKIADIFLVAANGRNAKQKQDAGGRVPQERPGAARRRRADQSARRGAERPRVHDAERAWQKARETLKKQEPTADDDDGRARAQGAAR